MAETAELTVLQRKAGAGRVGPLLAAMTPRKALRFAVARAADDALGCAASLSDLTESGGPPEELTATLPDPCLLLRLEAPGQSRGLAAFCPQAVGAMIEAQTMGRVLAGKAADRAPTRTDAMLVTDFLDRVLGGFAALSADCVSPPPVAGYVCVGPAADLRAAGMTLRDAEHLHYAIGLDFADGAKSGMLHLIVPAESAMAARGSEAADWTRRLNGAVLGSTAKLEAILCRQRLALSRITGLAVGDVLRLDTASLDRVALCGPDGRTVLTARLGRSGAVRALRLVLKNEAPQPAPTSITREEAATEDV